MTMTKIVDEKKYVGGFSKGIAESYKFKEYIGGGFVNGYYGHEQRNKKRDKVIESVLRETGLGNEGISQWLSSTAARHMMDNFDQTDNIDVFEAKVINATRNAFLEVTIWEHPDHQGTWASTSELLVKITNAVEGYKQGLPSHFLIK